jgi:LmbE family N-acetylglucosaminyl deacetylase
MGKQKIKQKIGIIVAHDDDGILGLGGLIYRYKKLKNDVFVIICTDGRTSHWAVLGVKNPSMKEVAEKRKIEALKAYSILGVKKEKIYFLNLTKKEGRVWQNMKEAESQIRKILEKEKPDIVYYHYPDLHKDHQAVSEIVSKIVNERKINSHQFIIWRPELSKGRREILKMRIKLPKNITKIKLKKEEKEIKRKALFEVKSQVMNWPYVKWPVQQKPILDPNFINFFLNTEEEII